MGERVAAAMDIDVMAAAQSLTYTPPMADDDAPHRGLTAHAAHNRAAWDSFSDEYQERHGGFLAASGGLAWGTCQIPEAELHVLGEVAGRDILELGCGAAQWSIALARKGARPVGLDFSARQLDHARRLMADAGVDFPLVHASAEAVPLPDASFDIVFCDFGAMTFADPYLTVPEASRLLRPGGLFAFSGHSPIATICWPLDADEVTDHLALDYFGMHAIDDGETISFQLPYGEWVRLFRASGFVIEDLIEPRPAAGATITYTSTEARAWARRWPAESIWRLRRA
jgi:SAM-dependent methyltransferase